ncbi:DUF6232 family protein [Paraburkholderia susongensis]|uniref:QacE n=1 Tax=Paraburkholderia susongensis TaxID=1515439 RepID=A0A1X7ICX8_9BURK|nr:DUF6232 family protein [Paraburkholderia susongensis]SMG12479.1 hypothetical protein SAMN06265784_101565 [Paraburkholderia susongensis]
MDERIFLEEGGVKVTSARFIVPAQTYAMSGITSVKSKIEPAKRGGPIVVGVVGLCAMFAGLAGVVIGAILIALAVLWWRAQKGEYHVLLHSSSGEAKALSSKDESFIGRVVAALNDSIVARG